jgi:hypothetical protein
VAPGVGTGVAGVVLMVGRIVGKIGADAIGVGAAMEGVIGIGDGRMENGLGETFVTVSAPPPFIFLPPFLSMLLS